MTEKALYTTLFLLVLFLSSCKFLDPNKDSTPDQDRGSVSGNFISEDEAKSVIIFEIQNDPMDRQYYTLGSPNFDERVRSIGWGKTVFVRRIPNTKYPVTTCHLCRGGYYYILTGVMPDGQVLGIEVVDAQTGKMLRGQRFLSQYADTLRMATPSECIKYAKAFVKGNLKCEAIYYHDGTKQTGYEHLTWKYLVQPKGCDAIASGFSNSNYVFIDPWIQNFKSDNTLKSTNGFLSRVSYFHRAFRFDSSKGGVDGRKMTPID